MYKYLLATLGFLMCACDLASSQCADYFQRKAVPQWQTADNSIVIELVATKHCRVMIRRFVDAEVSREWVSDEPEAVVDLVDFPLSEVTYTLSFLDMGSEGKLMSTITSQVVFAGDSITIDDLAEFGAVLDYDSDIPVSVPRTAFIDGRSRIFGTRETAVVEYFPDQLRTMKVMADFSSIAGSRTGISSYVPALVALTESAQFHFFVGQNIASVCIYSKCENSLIEVPNLGFWGTAYQVGAHPPIIVDGGKGKMLAISWLEVPNSLQFTLVEDSLIIDNEVFTYSVTSGNINQNPLSLAKTETGVVGFIYDLNFAVVNDKIRISVVERTNLDIVSYEFGNEMFWGVDRRSGEFGSIDEQGQFTAVVTLPGEWAIRPHYFSQNNLQISEAGAGFVYVNAVNEKQRIVVEVDKEKTIRWKTFEDGQVFRYYLLNDVTGDGWPDLLSSGDESLDAPIYVRDGRSLELSYEIPKNVSTNAVQFVDIDGDGTTEMFWDRYITKTRGRFLKKGWNQVVRDTVWDEGQ